MARKFRYRPLVLILLALAGIAALGDLVTGGEVLRLSQNNPGDSKPILLHANEVATWIEGGRRIIMLKGMVLVEQGVVSARMKEAVAWVDPERTRRTGILHLELYAEGDVHLENGEERRNGPSARVDFNTRGELKLKSYKGKVSQQAQATDPLYRAAVVSGLFQDAGSPAVQRTSASEAAAQGQKAGIEALSPLGPPSPYRIPVLPPAAGTGLPPAPVPPNPQPPPFGPSAPPAPSSALPGNGASPDVQQVAAWDQTTDLPPQAPSAAPPAAPAPGPVSADPASPVLPAPRPVPTVPAPAPAPPTTGTPAPTPSAAPFPPPPQLVPGRPGPANGPPPRPTAQGPPRQFHIVPRTQSMPYNVQTVPLPNGEQALVVTNGVILTVRSPVPNVGLLDIEADRLVVWGHENFQNMFNGLRGDQGHTTKEVEFYLAGNVEIREQNGQENRTLRADEVYYDVGRNVAVAYHADLEFKQPGMPEPMHLKADELFQLSPTQFKVTRAEVFSSRLPSDPGVKIYVAEGTLEEKRVPKKSIFGRQVIDRRTGQPEVEPQRLFRGDDVWFEVEDLPVLYLPFIQGDANDPMGPIQSVKFGYNRVYGETVGMTFNVWDLLGVDPVPGTRWRLFTDYLSKRGPALGSELDYAGKDLFDVPGKYVGLFKSYGLHDTGQDILGGGRGLNDDHPLWRGRFLFRHYQELPENFTVWAQASALSDKNFLEQYFKDEFDRDINQETFVYLKQQRDNWAWTVLTEPRIRNWVTETEWLPRADGYLLGQSLFDVFTYNARASAGYAQFRTTNVPPPPVLVTDQNTNTARFDFWQDLSLPFSMGAFKVVPYAALDLTSYTNDLTGNEIGRVYGAAGARVSIPFSHIYPDIQSDMLNLNAINHKVVWSLNYYAAQSNTPYTRLPQLDRLDDDATDQARRDITPMQPLINPAHSNYLVGPIFDPNTSGFIIGPMPLFDPQRYAIRRLVDDRVDTLDTIDVLQFDVRQRWQTKRGYPGMQHTVDWMVLDMSGSYFPHSKRDDFGESFAFLQYDWLWNVGDRTALTSTGWMDPINNGARVFTIGAFLNRPDRTNFFLGYRTIPLLNSQATTAAVTYIFSPKYAVTGSTTYDFGTGQSLSNSLIFTRMGSDLMLSLGINYNAMVNSFGVTFEIVPNAVSTTQRVPGIPPYGSSPLAAY